jgi:thiamine pyrophosphokinase
MRAILLGSQIESRHTLKKLLNEVQLRPTDLRVGVDGGVAHWSEVGLPPDIAVGDWDSLKEWCLKQKKSQQKHRKKSVHYKTLLKPIPHWTLPTQKDRADLFYAAVAALALGVNELVCLGVTGGRPDHHLATLLDLAELATGTYGACISVQAKGLEGDYFFLSEAIPRWTGSYPKGTVLSCFTLGSEPVQGLSLKGLKYPLVSVALQSSSLGLSNRVCARKCEVRLRNGKLVIIMPRNGYRKSSGYSF